MDDAQKRMMFAIGASFLFLFVWSQYFGPTPIDPQAPVETNETETVATPTQDASLPQAQEENPKTPPTEENVATPLVDKENVEVFLDTYEATLTNQGGVVSSLILHDYKKSLNDKGPGMQVIPMATPNPHPMLWTLRFDAQTSSSTHVDEQTVYEWIERGENNRYRLRTVHGPVEIEKTYVVSPHTFEIKQTLLLRNLTNQRINVHASSTLHGSKDPNNKNKGGLLSMFTARKTPVRVVSYIDNDVERFEVEEIYNEDADIPQGPISWAGFESQYFLINVLPVKARWDNISLAAKDDMHAQITYDYPVREIKPNSTMEYEVNLVAGPKDIEILDGIDESLKYSIDLGGILGPISRLILKLLRTLYGWVHNYGLAIILLTILVRLLLFPLAQKQAKSMKKMQAHKPQMDALKEQYGDDREAYSRALMEYMRTNKVNPAGGCFPLLLQFPIFIALYRVLYNSIELRHAPFVGWIEDLSAHDPYFVLPALVGITFYFQTKLNPSPGGDPAMQTMMKVMPIMFSVLMIFLPAGLNLYIFVSTLWGIVQQYWVQKT